MHPIRVRITSVCLCLLAIASPARAQYYDYDDSVGTASVGDYPVYNQNNFGGSYLLGNDGGSYLLFDKMVGNGPGYTSSYQRLGLRLKLFGDDSHLWTEGHVLVTDDRRLGLNVGGGFRFLVDDAVLGVHGWFDRYETDLNNRFHQTTFGVELLSQQFDVRANAYIPFGDQEQFVRVADPGTVPVFVDSRIAFLGTAFEEQAMKGFDAEIGVPLFQIPWVRAYGGGYYYDSQDGDDAPGARGRIEAAVSDDLSLNFMVTNDRVFDTNYNLGIEYRFSGGISAPTMCPFHGENRKYAQVRRQWPIATRIAEVPYLVESINPRTEEPYRVVHVDNTNAGPGDGTFEDPFDLLPDDAPGADLILVYTGVGSTEGNIALEPYQRLLGEGKPFTFLDAARGYVLLPESFGRTGPAPTLEPTDLAAPVILLSSFNEVNNFNIVAPTTHAIAGLNINSFHIEMITGEARNGIRILNASGEGVIRNFGMPGDPFEVSDTGVLVTNTDGAPLNLDIDNVLVSGGMVGMHIAAAGGDVNTDINGFRGNNHTDTGLILSAMGGSTHVADVDNAFVLSSMGATGRGIVLDVSAGGVMAATMNSVGAAGNSDLFTADVTDGQLHATITDSLFDDSTTGHGVRFILDNAVGRTTFENLFARRNAIDGVNADAAGMGTDYTVEVMDSSVYANMDDAFDTTVSGGATLRFFVDPTLAVMSTTGSGYEFDVSGAGSTLIADLIDTNLSMSGLHAVDGSVTDGGFANVALLRSLGTDSGDNGLNLNVDTGGTLIGWFDTGSFSRSGAGGSGNGVEVNVADGSTATLNFNNTPAEMNADNGLLFDVTDGMLGPSTLTINVTNGNFSNNPDANVTGSASGAGSKATLNFINTTASNMAALGGVVLDATTGGIINTNWTLGAISATGGNGVTARVDGPGSQIRLNLAGLTIQSNMGDGIDGTLTMGGPGSVLNMNLTSTTVRSNAGNGVDLALTGAGATSTVNMLNTLVFDNMGDGFEFDVLGGANLVATASGAGTFSSNIERAWHGTIDGMGSAAALTLNGTHGQLSGLEGGRFDITAGGLFNLTMSNLSVTGSGLDGLATSVDGMGSRANFFLDTVRLQNNGQAGAGDGFQIVATDSAFAHAELRNLTVTGNRDNGLRFDVLTGATVETHMNPPTVEGNGMNGLLFNVNTAGQFALVVEDGSFSNNGASFPASGIAGVVRGMGSQASTLFDGTTVDGNSRHGFDLYVDTGARLTTQLTTSGAFGPLSASGNTLSGVRFLALNGGPTVGNIVMSGPNEFNNNGADGVDIDGIDIFQMIAGFSGSAMDNGGDGVNIFMDTVTQAAIAIDGAGGTVSGNAGDGIDITLIDTVLTSLPFGAGFTPPLTINGVTSESNAGHGITVAAMNSNLTNGVISENVANDNMGDGIRVALTDSVADNLQIVRNNAADNTLNGINVELVRTPIDNLQIDDNGTFGGAMVNVGLQFFIDGNTLVDPFDISNSSDPGINLTNFSFDMSTSISGAIFNTVSGAATAFGPIAGTDVTTGLTTVNGTAVPPYPPGLVPDFTQLLALDFNDFNPGETFIWEIDADLTPGGQESVFGDQLVGSTVIVDFSNGVQLTGALMAVPGNPDASIFVATGMTGGPGAVTDNGLNG
ncbi:MAG: inverse autotransporter beta domain-containing protein, partial [Planctomycetaceae bacterium]